MLHGSVLLHGAPDTLIGTPQAKVKAVQVMHLDLDNDLLHQLLDAARRGKQPQLVLGRNPTIRFDGTSHDLHTASEKFRHELYRSGGDGVDNEWAFAGIINHSLRVEKMEVPSASVDKALETLKSHMASIEQQREARKLTVSTPELRALKGGTKSSKLKARATHLKPLANASSSSIRASSPHLAPPLSAGLDPIMPWDSAIKKALTHFLAVQPRSYSACRNAVRISDATKWMDRLAKKTSVADEWTLLDKHYKDLDVWGFKYKTQEERQAAIDNAVRAFDRMRISKSDDLWQMLLPVGERGQGKVLSRLNLNLQKTPMSGTPVVKPKAIDRKTGLPKRTEPKKADKEAKKAKKSKDTSEGEPLRAAPEKNGVRKQKANPPRAGATNERNAVRKTVGSSAAAKEAKSGTAAKASLNKPRNPSPLSASPPVNATDFEDDHPVHKALSAAMSPKRNGNRKANESAKGATYPRSDGIKRKAMEVESDVSMASTPVKQRKLNGTSTSLANGRRSPESGDSSASPPLVLSWRQSLDQAKKFRVYYDAYAKLYMKLSNSSEPPSQESRDKLLNMHQKLLKMKDEVRNNAG